MPPPPIRENNRFQAYKTAFLVIALVLFVLAAFYALGMAVAPSLGLIALVLAFVCWSLLVK